MLKCRYSTHVSFKVVFGEDLLDALGRRPDERRRVEVVHFVEVEEGGQVGEHLVADLVASLVALLDLVDDVVGHLVVLPAGTNEIIIIRGNTVLFGYCGTAETKQMSQ